MTKILFFQQVNYDLRHIVEWLRTTNVLLNSGKTELILFRSKNKKITKMNSKDKWAQNKYYLQNKIYWTWETFKACFCYFLFFFHQMIAVQKLKNAFYFI